MYFNRVKYHEKSMLDIEKILPNFNLAVLCGMNDVFRL